MPVVRDIMRTAVNAVAGSATFGYVAELLLHDRTSGLPVVDGGGYLVGVISDYDCLKLYRDPTLAEQPVSQFMAKDVVSVELDTPLLDVIKKFAMRRLHRLPVVNNGKLVGIVTRREILEHICRDVLCETAAR